MAIPFFSRDIGIDLGSSRTRIYVPYRGVVSDEPGALALNTDTDSLVCVGDCANEMIGRVPGNIEVHTITAHGAIQNEKIAEQYLRSILKKSTRSIFSIIKKDVLIGVPTNATSMEQRAIIQTCKRAGARNVFVGQNAILAAFGIGMHRDELRGRMVADIGAGLTEVAVISLGGMSSWNTVKVGGDDMDVSIVDYVRTRYQLFISRDTAKKIKEKIGFVIATGQPKEIRVRGSDTRTKLPRIVRVNSNDIADAIQREMREILKTIADVFRDTPPELTSDILEKGVVLTGGVANLGGIAEAVEKHINAPVYIADDSEHAVIRGIGRSIQTGHLTFHRQALLSK